jgi:predicted glycoside hydrolase/deacetylase ChbG (UPF0249 family)
MKKIFSLFIIAHFSFAQTKEIRLIIQADDIGFCHAVNRACMDVYKKGIARSVEVIVPSPWFMEAARMLKDEPGYDVGVHLCLTSEWINMRWRPMTPATSLRDPDGYFCPFIWPNAKVTSTSPGVFLMNNQIKIEEVEAEFRAQIETAKKYIPQLSHLTGHMGSTGITPQINEIVLKLAKEYNLFHNQTGYDRAKSWSGINKTPKEKEEAFIQFLQELEPGKSYYVIEHPGYDTDEMKAIGHEGYSNVGIDREGVTVAWTSEKAKKIIKDRNIKLLSVKEASTR